VRLAEICISAYGNLHVGARVVGAEDKEVVSQGVCWDLEKNVRVTIEKRRKITDKHGKRFNEDMINVTGNAAASIAYRDAAFRVIPRTYVNMIYEAARKVAVGDASTLSARRAEVFEKIVKMGAMPDRILARVGKAAVEDIGLAELEILIGLGTAIHSGAEKVDDVFPAPAAPVKGVVDLNSIKPAKEENRGHGQENLAAAQQQKPAETKPPEEKKPPTGTIEECSTSDFNQIEILAKTAGIPMKQVKAHVTDTMGFPMYGMLTKPRLDEVHKWIAANAKTESAAQGNSAQGGGSVVAGGPAAQAADIDPEARCTDDQFTQLENAQTENDVEPKVFIAWAKKTFDVKMVSHLKHKHFDRALAFLKAGGKE
jgi:hypothetical protein